MVALHLTAALADQIVSEQHACLTGRPTTTTVLVYHHYRVSAFVAGKQVGSVDHLKLIDKSRNWRIDEGLLRRISSYLSNRTQAVRSSGFISEYFKSTS